jgi:hypothetical protein
MQATAFHFVIAIGKWVHIPIFSISPFRRKTCPNVHVGRCQTGITASGAIGLPVFLMMHCFLFVMHCLRTNPH